jgi:GNAT superfamily N-acetyltransferase
MAGLRLVCGSARRLRADALDEKSVTRRELSVSVAPVKLRETAMEDLQIVYEPLPSEALTRFLSDNVININFARTGVSEWHPVGFFLKNARGEWLGGLTGYVWGGWMHVNFLWVAEKLRGKRHGTRLMDVAEAFAVEHGAFAVTLETLSFQAPGFYAKRGYEVFGRLEDYPPGHAKLYLRKRLDGKADC